MCDDDMNEALYGKEYATRYLYGDGDSVAEVWVSDHPGVGNWPEVILFNESEGQTVERVERTFVNIMTLLNDKHVKASIAAWEANQSA